MARSVACHLSVLRVWLPHLHVSWLGGDVDGLPRAVLLDRILSLLLTRAAPGLRPPHPSHRLAPRHPALPTEPTAGVSSLRLSQPAVSSSSSCCPPVSGVTALRTGRADVVRPSVGVQRVCHRLSISHVSQPVASVAHRLPGGGLRVCIRVCYPAARHSPVLPATLQRATATAQPSPAPSFRSRSRRSSFRARTWRALRGPLFSAPI